MAITHAKSSTKSDCGDTTLVRPSDWNADHTIASGTALIEVTFGFDTITANVAHRGMFYYTKGAAGTADKLYCIMKSAANTYSAIQIAIG